MKRVELLEALYLQGKKMRELQVYYFSLRKGGGRFSSPEAKKVLAQSKLEELQYDKMVAELDEWWGLDSARPDSDSAEIETCSGNCGMNYCDENGCVERKRILVDAEPIEPLKDDMEGCNPVNDGDDDIRI